MPKTVMLRLAGPMQAWSREGRSGGGGGRRPTSDHPTKTGVVGLVANALGRVRADNIDDLAGLKFAVRADRPGVPEVDFHTAGGGSMPRLPEDAWDGKTYGAACDAKRDRYGNIVVKQLPNPVMSQDGYLADAAFTVALTGEDTTIDAIAHALENPARVLHLGRVAYLPSEPVFAGLCGADDPVEALRAWPLSERHTEGPHTIWFESDRGQVVRDQPINFADRTANPRFEDITVL